jgi:hypothetical protein
MFNEANKKKCLNDISNYWVLEMCILFAIIRIIMKNCWFCKKTKIIEIL